MNKLFKLKKWLTLESACEYLSHVFSENITLPDLLQLALDGHIKISANFVNKAKACSGKLVLKEEADIILPSYLIEDLCRKSDEMKGLEYKPENHARLEGTHFSEEYQLVLDTKVISVEGVWDLLMVASGRLDIEHLFQQLTGGVEVTLINLEGTFVEAPNKEERQILQLQTSFSKTELKEYGLNPDRPREQNYYPAGGLPEDSTLVIRTDELTRFIKSLDEPDNEEKAALTTKSKNSYLATIYSLCLALTDGLTGKPNKDADMINSELARKGIEQAVGNKTLAKYISEAQKNI